MPRATRPIVALAAAVLVSGASAGLAHAQARSQEAPGEARGLRYLSWPGRAAPPVVGDPAPASTPAPARTDLRRPNRVIPHGGAVAEQSPRQGLTPAPGGSRQTLTPANAWMHPRPAPEPEAPPAPPPPPASPAPRALPEYLPDQGGRGQPAPAAAVLAEPAPSPVPSEPSATSVDPMAPRRDAPIFRLRPAADRAETATPPSPPAPAPATAERRPAQPPAEPRVAMVAVNPDDRPAPVGARYYSVHRQNGREPDALVMPQPTYVDALAITVPETPASQDLAQPDRGPTLIRDAQGRVRAQPAAPEGDYE